MKSFFTLIALLLFLNLAIFSQTSTSWKKNNSEPITWYEKIHIHTDRSIYFSGDTIWYKAYLIDCNHQVDTLSNILYVDLTDCNGKILERQKLKVENGTAYGDFAIDSSSVQGKYSINAFTSWMLNYSKHHSFHKTIDVYNGEINLNIDVNSSIYKVKQGDSIKINFHVNDINNWRKLNESHDGQVEYIIDYGKNLQGKGQAKINNDGQGLFGFNIPDSLNLDQVNLNLKVDNGSYREEKKIVVQINKKPTISFFPEGGHLVDSLKARVGFKGLTSTGKSFQFKGIIINSKNDTITEFTSNKLGMGSFEFTPVISEKYTAQVNYQNHQLHFPIPEIAARGYQLKVRPEKKFIEVEVMHNFTNQKTHNYLIFKQRHKIINAHQIENPGWLKMRFPIHHLPNGLITLTLTDEAFFPVAERLFYSDRKEQLNILISEKDSVNLAGTNKQITIKIMDHLGTPQASNLSISICQKNLTNPYDDHIFSRFNLSSEIKGKIEQPGFYFRSGVIDIENLDELLLTQGWRNYLWSNENINTTDTIAYKIDRGFTIEGNVQHRRKNKNIEGYQLHLFAQGDSIYFQSSSIDSTKQFSFNIPLFYGNNLIFLQGKSKKDRKRDIHIHVKESNLPTQHDSIIANVETSKVNIIDNLRTIKKTDHIKKMVDAARHVAIDEVVVTAKNLLPWYHETPEANYNMDSLDPKGDKYRSLFHFLEEEHGAYIIIDTSFQEHLMMPASGTKSFYDPIYLLDGVVIFDAGEDKKMYDALLGWVIDTPLNELKSIKVYEPGNYSAHFANTEILCSLGIWQSLVELNSYDRNFYRGNPLGVNIFTLQGLFKPHEFYRPPFDPFEEQHILDSRPTYYWNPNLVTNKKGKATIELPHYTRTDDLIINVEGINEDGSRYGAKVIQIGK